MMKDTKAKYAIVYVYSSASGELEMETFTAEQKGDWNRRYSDLIKEGYNPYKMTINEQAG
jgi:hypothetical protein